MIEGGKNSPLAGEINLSGIEFLKNYQEFARLWSEPGGQQTFIIEPRALGADPAMFGMAMVDTIRHAAKAYAHAVGISEEKALARIWEGFDAERANPTDEPVEIDKRASIQ